MPFSASSGVMATPGSAPFGRLQHRRLARESAMRPLSLFASFSYPFVLYLSYNSMQPMFMRQKTSANRGLPLESRHPNLSHKRTTFCTKICHAPPHPLKSPFAVFALAFSQRANTALATHSSTPQENNMQKNTTSLWAGSAVAGLSV